MTPSAANLNAAQAADDQGQRLGHLVDLAERAVDRRGARGLRRLVQAVDSAAVMRSATEGDLIFSFIVDDQAHQYRVPRAWAAAIYRDLQVLLGLQGGRPKSRGLL